MKLGDILYGSYGYNMTNVHFFQVTGVTASFALMREVDQLQVSGDADTGTVMPLPNIFTKSIYFSKDIIKRKIKTGESGDEYVMATSIMRARKWDGKSKRFNHVD